MLKNQYIYTVIEKIIKHLVLNISEMNKTFCCFYYIDIVIGNILTFIKVVLFISVKIGKHS